MQEYIKKEITLRQLISQENPDKNWRKACAKELSVPISKISYIHRDKWWKNQWGKVFKSLNESKKSVLVWERPDNHEVIISERKNITNSMLIFALMGELINIIRLQGRASYVKVNSTQPFDWRYCDVFIYGKKVTQDIISADSLLGLCTLLFRNEKGNYFQHSDGTLKTKVVSGFVTIEIKNEPNTFF